MGISVSRARRATTMSVLSISSDAPIGWWPGRVDSPPTSSMSAPSRTMRNPCATARSRSEPTPSPLNESGVTLMIRMSSTRSGLADLAAEFYGRPSRRLKVAGVTGTDGKTTTTHMAEHVLQASVRACEFAVAAFTNVGHDHLNYHASWED